MPWQFIRTPLQIQRERETQLSQSLQQQLSCPQLCPEHFALWVSISSVCENKTIVVVGSTNHVLVEGRHIVESCLLLLDRVLRSSINMRLPCRVCRMCITRRYNYTGISLIAIIVCLSYLYRFFIGSNFNSISLSYLLEDRDGKSYDNNLCCVLTTEYVLIYKKRFPLMNFYYLHKGAFTYV